MKPGVDYPGVCVVFVCHDGSRIVFHKRSANARDEQGTWDVGGGAVTHGDDVIQKLRDEIKEEYGADVLAYEFLGYRDVHREHQGKKTHWIGLDFLVLVDPLQVRNAEPHKFDDITWLPLGELPTPAHSELNHIFTKYNTRFHQKIIK